MEWISVEDRLPQNFEHVLAYAIENEDFPFLDARFFEASHYNGRWTECVDTCLIDVTHWMPLPEPPNTSSE